MDKLKDIKKEAKKIEKSDPHKVTKKEARAIGKQAAHELGEIKRKEWIRNPKMKKKEGDADPFNARKADVGKGMDTDPNQPVTPLMIPHIIVMIGKSLKDRRNKERRDKDER